MININIYISGSEVYKVKVDYTTVFGRITMKINVIKESSIKIKIYPIIYLYIYNS